MTVPSPVIHNQPLQECIAEFPATVTQDPTQAIVDASKLKTYLTCPRQFFYEYILGWRRDSANIHLIFGEAMHDALEHMLLNGYEEDSIYDAYQLFEAKYREHFPDPDQDDLWFPKIPSRAFQVLPAYAGTYHDDHELYEVIETEIAGKVTVTPHLQMHFRMDAILRDRATRTLIGQEHKTGSQLNNQWTLQWQLDMQPNLYLHALKSHYGPDEVGAVLINGLFFTKNKGTRGGKLFEFHREPIIKSNNQMNAWFSDLQAWLGALVWDYKLLTRQLSTATVMTAFPRNGQSCSKYFGCAFHDFCVAWANPLKRCQEPPPGFKIEYWDPSAREAKKVIAA